MKRTLAMGTALLFTFVETVLPDETALEAEVAALVADLGSPDAEIAGRAAAHLRNLGALAVPALRALARSTGDPRVERRAGALLLEHGIADLAQVVVCDPEAANGVASRLLQARPSERARFIEILSGLEREPGAERCLASAAYLRLAAGDLPEIADGLALILTRGAPSFANTEEVLVRAGAEALELLRAEFTRRTDLPLGALRAYARLECRFGGGGRLGEAIAEHIQDVPLREGTWRVATPEWLAALLAGALDAEPEAHRMLVASLPPATLAAFFELEGIPLALEEGIDEPDGPAGSGALFRALAEKAKDPNLRAHAWWNLVVLAEARAAALAELEAYAGGLEDGDQLGGGFSFLLPSTPEKVRVLGALLKHPARDVRRWAPDSLSLPFERSSRSKATQEFRNKLPEKKLETMARAARDPESTAAAAGALLDALEPARERGEPLWSFAWDAVGHRRLPGRAGPAASTAVPEVEEIHRVLEGWAAGASEEVRLRIRERVIKELREVLDLATPFVELPDPPVSLLAESLGDTLIAASGGDPWALTEFAGGPTLLVVQKLKDLPRPVDPAWDEDDRRALLRVAERAADPAGPPADREELLRLLAAYLAYAVPPPQQRSVDPVRECREILRPAIADPALSPGHRALALAVVRERRWQVEGEEPGARRSLRRTGARRAPARASRGRRVVRRAPVPAPDRREVVEADSLIVVLDRADPIFHRYATDAARTLRDSIPVRRLPELYRALAESPAPGLRAFAAGLDKGYSSEAPALGEARRETGGSGSEKLGLPLAAEEHREIARSLALDPERSVRRAAWSTLYHLLGERALLDALLEAEGSDALEIARLLESLEEWRAEE